MLGGRELIALIYKDAYTSRSNICSGLGEISAGEVYSPILLIINLFYFLFYLG